MRRVVVFMISLVLPGLACAQDYQAPVLVEDWEVGLGVIVEDRQTYDFGSDSDPAWEKQPHWFIKMNRRKISKKCSLILTNQLRINCLH